MFYDWGSIFYTRIRSITWARESSNLLLCCTNWILTRVHVERQAMVATGASAAIIPITGLKETPHLTNSNFWNLEELPERMGVIGAGPIGLEMSQAMQRFGCKVMDLLR